MKRKNISFLVILLLVAIAIFSLPVFAACSNSCDSSSQYSCTVSTSTMYKDTRGTLTVSVTNQQSQSQSVTAELTGNWYTGFVTSVAGNTYNSGQATSVDFSITPSSNGAQSVCVKMGTTCTADCGSVTVVSAAELSVVSMTPSSATVSPSSSFTVSATIQNLGTETAGASTAATATLSSSSACTVSSATKTIGTIVGSASTSQNWAVTAGSSTGTCTLSLSVSGTPGGTATKTATVTISTTTTDTSSTTGSSGSSGGGSTTEDTKKKKWTLMDKGVVHKMMITDKTLGIKEILIEVHNKAHNVSITVTKLSGQPASVTHSITGNVFQWVEIAHSNLSDDNLKSLKIRFNVSRSWLINNSLSPGDVALQRYSNGWAKLATSNVGETSSDYEFEAVSPGLSVFAVAAERPSSAPAIACGNNIREGAEECDGTDMAGQTCVSKGFGSGSLKCNACMFDTSGCRALQQPTCGNGACESGETSNSCPDDCRPPIEIPKVVKDYGWIITLAVIIVVGILGWFYYHGHKHVRKFAYKYRK